jgi:hypothetical protein
MLTRRLVPVLTLVLGAGLAFGGCGSSSSSNTGGAGGGGGATAGSGGSTGGSGGATGGSGGATGGAGGSTGGSGGTAGTGGSAGAGGSAGTGGSGGAGGAGGRTVFKCGGAGNSSNSCTPAEINAHNMCVGSKCLDAYSQCLGPAFKDTGVVGGLCGTWFTCFNACNCGDFQCWAACGMPPAACTTCLENAGKCQETMCPEPACLKPKLDGGVGGADGGAGGSCDDLKKCCDAIADANLKAACNAQAGMGNAGTCGATLSGFKAGGLCP